MTQQELIKRLETTCFGLDPVDPLRLLVDDVIEALREHAMREVQRLGQEIEQEPAAKYSDIVSDGGLDPRNTTPPQGIYYTPPQRTWVGLTDDEIDDCFEFVIEELPQAIRFYQAIEAKLKEKNT